jgi:hypothetical protein
MNENIFLAAVFFPSAAAVLVFFMKYTSAILQARVRLGQDEAYRDIAARAAAAQAETASSLAAIQSQLAAVMKILKDVE